MTKTIGRPASTTWLLSLGLETGGLSDHFRDSITATKSLIGELGSCIFSADGLESKVRHISKPQDIFTRDDNLLSLVCRSCLQHWKFLLDFRGMTSRFTARTYTDEFLGRYVDEHMLYEMQNVCRQVYDCAISILECLYFARVKACGVPFASLFNRTYARREK